jgi:hypothetical protein
MIDVLASIWSHPLGQCSAASTNHVIAAHEIARCKSYNWYSGLFADFGEITLIGSLITLFVIFKQHNCKAHWWCPFWGSHKVDGTTASVCHWHHTEESHKRLQRQHEDKHPDRLAHGESPNFADRHDTD